MNRRQLLGRAAALCGVAAILPHLAEFQPAAVNAHADADAEALYRDVLANPGKHPELEALARDLHSGARITDARVLMEPTVKRIDADRGYLTVEIGGATNYVRYWA